MHETNSLVRIDAEDAQSSADADAEQDAAFASCHSQVAATASSGDSDTCPSQAPVDNPQTQTSDTSKAGKQSFFRSFLPDEYRIWTAPFQRRNYDSHAMKKYGVPFLLISAASIATDRRSADVLPNTRDQEIWSGRVSQIGAAYTLAGFAGATYLIGVAKRDRHVRETSVLALQALAHSQLIVFGLKQMTQRERPIVDKQRVGFWKGGNSFPSGHATGSFAVAAVFAYEYRHRIVIPMTAYSVATVVAASRMSAHRHWVSDAFVGSSLGFMIGRYVYKRHHDPSLSGSLVDRKSRLVPEVQVGPGGLLLSWGL
ncbi:MAG: phosphatase PAP2 family protein [Acidobacteria bacterium]|nr:phosphatase PAP2 family protein [Acidobacteriota bacterium]